MPNSHLLNILSDIGVSADCNIGSPASLLSLIRLNEEAQAAIAKAKETVAMKVVASDVGDVGSPGEGGGLPPTTTKRGGLVELNHAWPRPGQVFVSKIYLSDESCILEHS